MIVHQFAPAGAGFLFGLWVLWSLGLQERVPDSPSPAPSLEDHRRPGSHPSSHRSSSVSSSPAHTESSSDRIRRSPPHINKAHKWHFNDKWNISCAFAPPLPAIHHNGLSMNHALLGLSPNIPPGPKEGDLAHDMSHEAATHKRMHADKGETCLFALVLQEPSETRVQIALERRLQTTGMLGVVVSFLLLYSIYRKGLCCI